ncbi:MAG TPA: NADH-quinone oxidoreductase subunit C [Euzebyales bacterium]|nr:NADH-quinone oxidoreductase subunit C [Euzebyales bacterium]
MTTLSRDVEPRPLSAHALADHLSERLEQRVVEHRIEYGQLTVTVVPEALPGAVQLCRDDPRLAFDFFDFMSGVDEREDGFAVITHLYSTHHRHHIQIRALATGGREDPHLPTISHLYAGANWHERETYDMYGITFDGHPGLLPRILTVENFEGFPLRKDFLLMTREVKPWPGLKEPKEATDEEDGDGEAPAGGPSAEDKARMAREKAERAKAKAAEARKRRAREQAGDAVAATPAAAQGDAAAAPSADGSADATRGAAADATKVEQPADNVDVGAEKEAELAAGAGDDEIAGEPIAAAEVADTAIAKDAAAGAVAGDTAAGAPGDEPGVDQPVQDRAREAEIAGGADAHASGTPGVEAEGRHAGADEQGGDVPASQTPGMTSPTQEDEPAQGRDNVPAPAVDAPSGGDDAGGVVQPLEHDEPRALAGEGVSSVPLTDEQGATVGGTYREDAGEGVAADTVAGAAEGERRPMGTDADDRLREREAEAGGATPASGGSAPGERDDGEEEQA